MGIGMNAAKIPKHAFLVKKAISPIKSVVALIYQIVIRHIKENAKNVKKIIF